MEFNVLGCRFVSFPSKLIVVHGGGGGGGGQGAKRDARSGARKKRRWFCDHDRTFSGINCLTYFREKLRYFTVNFQQTF